jgi:hypothetical protein
MTTKPAKQNTLERILHTEDKFKNENTGKNKSQ